MAWIVNSNARPGKTASKRPSKGPHPVIMGVLACLLLTGCKDAVVEKVDRVVPVRVTKVALENLTETRNYTGVIRPRFESDLGFRVAGKLIERKVNVGDTVKAGDVLARLDPVDFRLAVASQEAELSAAKSNRDQAAAALQRYVTLNQKGWAAQAALDTRVAAADEASSRVTRAERALETQRNQVAYTQLLADHDGIVSTFPVEAGQVVAAGQVVTRIARLEELEAVAAIPEQRLDEVKTATAAVELWPATGKKYAAKVREIAPTADAQSRTFDVRFSIAAPDLDVRLGKTANVSLQQTTAKPVATLPLSAVMNDAKGPMVWVVDSTGGKIERRAVSVASFGQDTVVIESGLSAGERVVSLGVHTLDSATAVRIVETKPLRSARNDVPPQPFPQSSQPH